MSRWAPGAASRLEEAALALFAEQGFTATSVPQIAARAGLTTRTFFRHFPDKREVLFAGEDEIGAWVGELAASAPPEWAPMTIIEAGLPQIAERFEAERDYLLVRCTIVESDLGLRERELQKFEAMGDALKRGFLARGLGDLEAAVAARASVVIVNESVSRWLAGGGERPLLDLLHETAAAFRGLTAGVGVNVIRDGA